MRYVNYIVAIAALAATVAGCADPYYPLWQLAGLLLSVRLQLSGEQLSGELPLSGELQLSGQLQLSVQLQQIDRLGIATTTEFTLGRNEPFLSTVPGK
jgi:hypothetical protein